MKNTSVLELKLQNDSEIIKFISWFEVQHSTETINEETGKTRKRKGNGKKGLITGIEELLSTGKVSPEFENDLKEYKESKFQSPEILNAKNKLSKIEFEKFVELMEKVKSGVPV